jgi:DNA-directed RNA polymerase specialized sigma24 family protein
VRYLVKAKRTGCSVIITQEQFDSLLSWLNTDRELAGKRYETIRSSLVKTFVLKGFNDAEDLADETINRVMGRLPDIRICYTNEPANYFYGVARNVVRERRRRREISAENVEISMLPKAEPSEESVCLGHCLRRLSASKRDLILDYYLYEGHVKIEHHKDMAGELKITTGAIRNRAHKIRSNLADCMRQCALIKKGQPCPLRSLRNEL